MNDGSHSRADRIAERIKRELGDLLQREVKDPRLKRCVVANVRVSGDLKVAWIGLSVYPEADIPDARRALERAGGFLRREVSRKLELRRSPELRFEFDAGAKRLIEMTELLKTVELGDAPNDAPNDPPTPKETETA